MIDAFLTFNMDLFSHGLPRISGYILHILTLFHDIFMLHWTLDSDTRTLYSRTIILGHLFSDTATWTLLPRTIATTTDY